MQVIFAVTDLARSLEFYENAFGWPRNDRIEFATYVELLPPDGGALGLCESEMYEQLVGSAPAALNGDVSPVYVYVRVGDVDVATERVEAAGGRLLSPPAERSWGEKAAWFADPDGNVVAIGQPLPGSAGPAEAEAASHE